jgi:hypothetical protein
MPQVARASQRSVARMESRRQTGWRADVDFIAGMIIDKFAYYQPLYRQHVKLQDSGINVSRAWIRKLMPAAVSLLEPIFNA